MTDDTLSVIRPGSTARISIGGQSVRVLVNAVSIKASGLVYSVSWLNNADYREAWVAPYELEPDAATTRVGVWFHDLAGG